MAVVEIPIKPDAANQSLTVRLSDTLYIIDLNWNDRAACWYISLSTVDAAPIWAGVKLVSDFPLGFRCLDDRRPAGVLLAVDTSKQGKPAGRDDLGSRVQLLFYDAAELV